MTSAPPQNWKHWFRICVSGLITLRSNRTSDCHNKQAASETKIPVFERWSFLSSPVSLIWSRWFFNENGSTGIVSTVQWTLRRGTKRSLSSNLHRGSRRSWSWAWKQVASVWMWVWTPWVTYAQTNVSCQLTTANHVFMVIYLSDFPSGVYLRKTSQMDCWWNAATENQGRWEHHHNLFSCSSHHLAIDRVHRIGQEKTVYVKHFIVSKSLYLPRDIILNLCARRLQTP